MHKLRDHFPPFTLPVPFPIFASWNNQLLSERITSDDLEAILVPVRFEKFKYRPSQILGKYLFCQQSHFGHGWRAFEGFDFVGEAAVCIKVY